MPGCPSVVRVPGAALDAILTRSLLRGAGPRQDDRVRMISAAIVAVPGSAHRESPAARSEHRVPGPGRGGLGGRPGRSCCGDGRPGADRTAGLREDDRTWQGAGGAGGVLAPLLTTAVAAFRVAESQALNTSGTDACRAPARSFGEGRNRARAQKTGCPRPSRPAPRVKSDGQQTTAVRRPGPAERQPQVHQRTRKGTRQVHGTPVTIGQSCLIST